MTNAQLAKIWSAICTFLLYFTLDSYLVTQGGEGIFGTKLIAPGRAPTAVIALVVCPVLLILTSLIGFLYAKRSEGGIFERVPVFLFDTINTSASESKIYQLFTLAIFSILPILSLIHFWEIFLDAPVATTSHPIKKIGSVWDWGYFGWRDPARICTEFDEVTSSCKKGVTVFPGLEPWILVILTTAASVTLICFFYAVFRPKTPALTSHNEQK
jgi:hypothetical protein